MVRLEDLEPVRSALLVRSRPRVPRKGASIRADSCSSGTGWGRGIIADLVAVGGGSITTDTGPGGTAVRVVLPVADRVDDHVF